MDQWLSISGREEGVLDLGQMSDRPDGLLDSERGKERKNESRNKLECVFLWEEMGGLCQH